MYNIRLAFAFLFPGFIPTIILIIINGKNYSLSGISDLTIYILGSLAVGVFIDLLRHRFEKLFVNYLGMNWIKKIFKRIVKVLFRKEIRIIDLKAASEDYDLKEKEVIKFWIKTQLDKNITLKEKVIANKMIEREYYYPTISSGDRWALQNLLSSDSMDFYLKEYFSFYQFSFNSLIAFVICFFADVVYFYNNWIKFDEFWKIGLISLLFIIILHERTVHWLLSCRRYARKTILYSIIKCNEEKNI